MINNGVSKKILIIGADYKEKGGIASVIKSHKHIMETFIFVPSYVAGSKMIKIYYLLIAICAIIYKCIFGGIKIVHVHTASNIDFYRNTIFIYIAKLCNKKVLLHIHGGKFEEFYKKNKGFVRITCNKCDLLLAVSTYFVKFIEENKLNDNVCLIPNYISKPSINKVPKKNTRYINLLYMGRIDENKGVFQLLEVLEQNKSVFKGKIILNIAGNGNVRRLQQIIEDKGLLEFVKFHGWADENKKKELLSNSDIYIQLSEFESFGISILEAMSYGLPIITTGVGGVTDLVKDMKNGIIVQRHNYASIFNAIMFFVENELDRIKFGLESKRISKQYFPEKIEEKLDKIYNEILND